MLIAGADFDGGGPQLPCAGGVAEPGGVEFSRGVGGEAGPVADVEEVAVARNVVELEAGEPGLAGVE